MVEPAAIWRRVGDYFNVSKRAVRNGGASRAAATGPDVGGRAVIAHAQHAPWWRRSGERGDRQRELSERLVDLLDSIQTHLRQQDARGADVSRSIDRMATVIEQLGDAVQQDRGALRAMGGDIENVARHVSGIQATLARVPDALVDQARAVHEMAMRLRASDDPAQRDAALSEFTSAVQSLSTAQRESAAVLAKLDASQRGQHEAFVKASREQGRRFVIVVALLAGIVFTALAVTVYAISAAQ